MEQLPSDALTASERQWRIDHAGRIDKVDFKIALGVFPGLAVLVALLRCVLRLRYRGHLALDDYLVVLATISLIIVTGLMYHFLDWLYLVEAVNIDSQVTLTMPEIETVLGMIGLMDGTNALVWTVMYSIKFSFLAFFKSLITNASRRLTIYYWFTIVFTGLTWGYVVAVPFILCPYFGWNAMKCFPNTPYHLNLGLTSMIAALDIVTDIMIISIPMAILNMTRLNRIQKAKVALCLCLSIAMIIVALIRVIGAIRPSLRSKHDFDTQWEYFWQHFEASIAVCMGSITTFRSIPRNQLNPSSNQTSQSEGSALRRLLIRLGLSKTSTDSRHSWKHGLTTMERNKEPRIQDGLKTHATFKGLRTFIRRNNRDPGNTTITVGTELDPLEEYHEFQRKGKGVAVQAEQATSQASDN